MNEQWNSPSLGVWPFDQAQAAASSAYTAVTTSTPAKELQQQLSVATGYSAPPTIYATVRDEQRATPRTTAEAYARGVFWLNLAIQRGNFDGKAAVAQFLSPVKAHFEESYQRAAPSITSDPVKALLCEGFGIGCETKGRADILDVAANSIRGSALAQADKDQIIPALEAMSRSVRWRQAAPYLTVVALGASAAAWWQYKKRRGA